jgi:hypothetical protein
LVTGFLPAYQFSLLKLDDNVVSDQSKSFDVVRHSADGKVGVADCVGDGERHDDVEHVETGQSVGGEGLCRNRFVTIAAAGIDILKSMLGFASFARKAFGQLSFGQKTMS